LTKVNTVLLFLILITYNISVYSQANEITKENLIEHSKEKEKINVLIAAVFYDWEEKESIGKINNRNKTLASKEILKSLGYAGVLDNFIETALEGSYIVPTKENKITSNSIELYIPKVVIEAHLKSVDFNLSGKVLNQYAGNVSAKGVWKIYSRTDRSKVLKEIPFNTSYTRESGSYDYILEPIIESAAIELALNDSIYSYLRKVEDQYFEQIKGERVYLKIKSQVHQNDLTAMERAIKSVVTIDHSEGGGSGVIVSKNGYILTNYHVIKDAKKLTITLNDKTTYEAKVIKTNSNFDVALLKIEADSLYFLPLIESANLTIGEDVYAIGTPLSNQLSQTVSRGIISGIREVNRAKFIQTDVSINLGNSGGALINLKGDFIAIPTFRSGYDGAQGLGFCVPVSTAIEMLNLDIY
jgi:S1-C subfamily serine protease